MIGFSVTHGAMVRYIRRCASPRRSRSVLSWISSNVRNVSKCLARIDDLVRPERRPAFQQAARRPRIVDLRRVLRIGHPIDDLVRALRVRAEKRVVALDLDRAGRFDRCLFDGGGFLDGRQNFAGEFLKADRLVGAVVQRQPLAEQRDAVVKLVMDANGQALRKRRGSLEREHEAHAGRRPGQVRAMPDAFPPESLFGLADFETGQLKGTRVGRHLVEPLGQEIGVVGLAPQPPHRVGLVVDREDRLGLDAAEQRLARAEVVERDGGEVGSDAKRPGDQAIGQDDFIGIPRAKDAGPLPRRRNQPVALGACCCTDRQTLKRIAHRLAPASDVTEREQSL